MMRLRLEFWLYLGKLIDEALEKGDVVMKPNGFWLFDPKIGIKVGVYTNKQTTTRIEITPLQVRFPTWNLLIESSENKEEGGKGNGEGKPDKETA